VRLIKKIPILFILWLLYSCGSSDKKETCGSAWVGGEIVNPNLRYVVISHNRDVLDTVPLNERNFFHFKIDQVDPGIYFISHFEYQAFHLEPGDSLMLRVNTIEFDESLTYSGRGAEKNNFLMELFLLNEQVDELLPSYYNLSPQEFEGKMDSIRTERYQRFEEFQATTDVSKSFISVAEASIDYSIYSKKELYISANAAKQQFDESISIPEEFYAFRKEYDFGNEMLRNYYPYYRCIEYYIDNLAYDSYKSKSNFHRQSFTHNYHKLEIIDSLITNDSLRNSLLRTSIVRYLVNGNNAAEESQILNAFKEYNNNPGDIKDITKLAEASMQLAPGNPIPNVMLLSTENTAKDLHTIIKRPTVFYFWSSRSISHYKSVHTRASELRSKFPEFNFIGVNIDDHFKKWRRIVTSSGYNFQYEYQFDSFDEAKEKLLLNNVKKTMIVDGNGMIINGNTNLFGLDIEQQLLAYLNQ